MEEDQFYPVIEEWLKQNKDAYDQMRTWSRKRFEVQWFNTSLRREIDIIKFTYVSDLFNEDYEEVSIDRSYSNDKSIGAIEVKAFKCESGTVSSPEPYAGIGQALSALCLPFDYSSIFHVYYYNPRSLNSEEEFRNQVRRPSIKYMKETIRLLKRLDFPIEFRGIIAEKGSPPEIVYPDEPTVRDFYRQEDSGARFSPFERIGECITEGDERKYLRRMMDSGDMERDELKRRLDIGWIE